MALVGVASVKITPDLSTLRRELNKGLKAIKAEVAVQVEANTTKAKAHIERFVAKESGQTIQKNIEINKDSIRLATGAIQKLGGTLTRIAGTGAKIALVATAFTAVSAASQTLGPLLTASLGTLLLIPGAALAAAGAMAAIKLGADGAKRAFERLKPTIDSLKASVGASFEKSLIPAVNNLKGILPQLRSGFQQIVTAIGGVAAQTTGLLKSTQGIGALRTILSETGRVIQNIGSFLAPVIAGFVQIGAIGLPIIREMTAGLGAAGSAFLAFTQSAQGAAQIKAFIQGGLDALKQLFAIGQQVFGIISNIFAALSAGGGALGGTILPVLTSINQALGSAGMMNAITGIGTAFASVAKTVGSALGPVIQTVLPLLSQALQSAAPGVNALVVGFGELLKGIAPALPAVGNLARVLGEGLGKIATALGPILGQLAETLAGTLADAIPALVPVITDLVKVLGEVLNAVLPIIGPLVKLASSILQPLIGIVAALVPPFTQLVQSALSALEPMLPVIADAFKQLGTALAPIAGLLGQQILSIFQALLPAVGPLVTAVLELVKAFLPFIPVIGQWISITTPILVLVAQLIAMFIQFQAQALTPLIKIFGVFSGAVATAMGKVNNTIQTVVNAVTGFFTNLLNKITSTWNSIYSKVSGSVDNIKGAVTNGFNAVVSFVGSIPGRIIGALGDLGSLLFNSGKSIIQGLINGIKAMAGAVANAVSGVLSAARNLLPFSPAKTGPFSGKGWTLYSGMAISEALADGILKSGGEAVRATEHVMDQVNSVFGAQSPALSVADQLNANLRTQLTASADIATAPVIVNVNTREDVLRDFVTVEIEESGRETRRRVLSGIGG